MLTIGRAFTLRCSSSSSLQTHHLLLPLPHLSGCWHAAWLLLSSGFSDSFPRDEWLQAWDHILLGPPAFAPCLAASLLLHARDALLAVRSPSAALLLLRAPCGVAVDAVLLRAYDLAVTHGGKAWQTPPTPLGASALYPAFGPVPEAAVARAVAQSEEDRATEELVARREAAASALAGRADKVAAMTRVWEEERARMEGVKRAQTAQRDALEPRPLGEAAAAAGSGAASATDASKGAA